MDGPSIGTKSRASYNARNLLYSAMTQAHWEPYQVSARLWVLSDDWTVGADEALPKMQGCGPWWREPRQHVWMQLNG